MGAWRALQLVPQTHRETAWQVVATTPVSAQSPRDRTVSWVASANPFLGSLCPVMAETYEIGSSRCHQTEVAPPGSCRSFLPLAKPSHIHPWWILSVIHLAMEDEPSILGSGWDPGEVESGQACLAPVRLAGGSKGTGALLLVKVELNCSTVLLVSVKTF